MGANSEGFGGLNCPKCGSILVEGNAPFYLHGQYVGIFKSLICKENSHFYALTESGYRDATRVAQQLGLIGPAEEVHIEEEVDTEEEEVLRVALVKMVAQFQITPMRQYHH